MHILAIVMLFVGCLIVTASVIIFVYARTVSNIATEITVKKQSYGMPFMDMQRAVRILSIAYGLSLLGWLIVGTSVCLITQGGR